MYIYTISAFKEEFKEIIISEFSTLEYTEGIEEKENEIDVYTNHVSEFENFLSDLNNSYQFNVSKNILEDKNWNEIWESNFEPIIINKKVGIRATFHEKLIDVENEILIQPKMSFGTGHHDTTAQMMKLMQLLDFNQKKVLDLGSGTAILAIYAAVLGANDVDALDNDIWCFENSKENITLNHCTNINPILGNIEDVLNKKYDIILANIHKNYHLENIKHYTRILNQDSYILLSGFYENDAQDILNKALEYNLISNYCTIQNNWMCIMLQNKLN